LFIVFRRKYTKNAEYNQQFLLKIADYIPHFLCKIADSIPQF